MNTHLRRLLTVLVAALGLGAASVLLAGPAAAAVPEGWPGVKDIDTLYMLLVLGGTPVALFLLITFLVYAPAVARGERVTPGAPATDDAWIGGPHRLTAELAGPHDASTQDSAQAGGASGRW